MNTTEYEEEVLRRLREEQRCPLCAMVREREFDILSHLQYQVTHDEALRNTIAEEGGFCDFHFRQFRKLANAETNSLLLITMVQAYSSQGNSVQATCRLCSELALYESSILEATVGLMAEESARAAYADSSGLCLIHMHAVEQRLDDPHVRLWLRAMQSQQMKRNLPSLVAMSTRSFFDTTQSQRSSILCIVEKFVGRKALGL